MEKYKLKIKPDVFRMLDKHIIFLAKISSKSAQNLRKTFIDKINNLTNNPESHPLWLPDFELSKPYRKILIKKRYQILFYIDNNTVYVDYLLDCRMDSNKFFEKF